MRQRTCLRVVLILFVGLCIVNPAQPAGAQIFFTWNDDRATVVDNLQALIDEMKAGRDAIGGPGVRESINDAAELLTSSLPSRGDVLAFENQACDEFRDDLILLTQGLFSLGNNLANFHGLPLEVPIEDPGLAGFIPRIPCALLLPVSKVTDKLAVLDRDVGDRLFQASTDLELLKALVYPEALAAASPVRSTASSFELPGIAEACMLLAEREAAVGVAHAGIRSVGFIALSLGTLLQAIGKTALAGPDQVEVAVWGWVGTRIRNTPAMTVGNFLAGSGHALLSVSAAVSRTRHFCALRDDHERLLTEHELLLKGQAGLQAGQEEIVRLLLTPQGRRASEFCHGESCAAHDFPLKPAR